MSTMSSAAEPSGVGKLARTISRNVERLRTQRGVSQADIARAVGLPQSGISARLAGRTQWTADDIEAVALAFSVPVTELMKPVEEEDEEPRQLAVVRRRPARAHTDA